MPLIATDRPPLQTLHQLPIVTLESRSPKADQNPLLSLLQILSSCLKNFCNKFIMKAEELDKIFDDGKEDILPYLDMSTLRRPNLNQKRVNVDLPTWMIQRLDRQANLIGVTRQSIIKVWLSERIKEEYAER
jgi:hypothetical protein